MKNKKILIIILIIALGLTGLFFGYKLIKGNNETKLEEEVKSNITPLLYEVTKEGETNKMYLFGSIHIANKSDLVFPEYVLNAYKNSDYLACEFNIIEYTENQEKLLRAALDMMYQDGTTIKDHLSSETYNKLINFLTEKKSYLSLLENYKLYAFLSIFTDLISQDANINSNSVDEYFLKKAINDKKTILEVESYDYQTNLLEEFPDELYELMMDEFIDEYDESVEEIKKLYNAWKTGNEEELVEYGLDDVDILDSYTKEQKEFIEEYNKKLVIDRNEKMVEKAVEYFNQKKNVFYMVGVAHIIGENGIANKLKENGFTVKQINY